MYEDSPEDVAIDKLFEKCYDGSALGRPILGTEETLAPITTETMHKYMHEYYRPEDTVIAVSGHFTDDDLDYIADLFSVMTGLGPQPDHPGDIQALARAPQQEDRAEPPVSVLPRRVRAVEGPLHDEPAVQHPRRRYVVAPVPEHPASRTACATRSTRSPRRTRTRV